MNYIYSIAIFVFFSTMLFGIGSFSGEATFFVFGCILLGISVIFIFVGFFQNLEAREEQKRCIIGIRTLKKKISLRESLVTTYKLEIEKSLIKLYPEYEKEIFKNMAPSDAENLNVFLVKYPELKFNGILQSFTNHLTDMLERINGVKRELENSYEEINIRNNNDWFLWKLKLPENIKKILKEE